MFFIIDFKRHENENEEQYLFRLGQMKDSGLIDMGWKDIADIMNREFRKDESEYLDKSSYRKPYSQAKRFLEAGVFTKYKDDDYENEIKNLIQELKKERVKVRRERNELNRVIREEADKESYMEQILRAISECHCKPLVYDASRRNSITTYRDNDLVVSFTDVHTGIEIDNYWNKFNEDVLAHRITHYLDKIIDVQKVHGSENIHVIMSELVSGIIHATLRIENNQNLIEQFLTIMEYLSGFLAELSFHFRTVEVYMCPGNHSRISPKKEDSLKGENIDHLAIPFLEAKLQNYKNINFNKNDIEESVAMFSVRGNTIMAAHGDKDSPDSAVQKFTMMFGIKPDIVYLGHRHTNGMVTVYDTKVLSAGCFSGIDPYAVDKRLRNKPEQVISVITQDGLECFYDVRLDR